MSLTLEQYATQLDGRRDLSWPSPAEIRPPKAKAHLVLLPHIRVVTWNIYGTLLAIPTGELLFQHPQQFIMDIALDKTVQEFKMWGSMTRKPGQPAEYLRQLYTKAFDEQRMAPSPGEKHPEILAERVWENIVKKLFQKEYKFDAGFFGSLNEYTRKIAYFFHASLQGTTCYPGAADALGEIRRRGLAQGVLADGQCFTLTQLQRGLVRQNPKATLDLLFDADLRVLSSDVKARKPSERLFREMLPKLSQRGLEPFQVLHIGSRVAEDLVPARKLGMRTGLVAADKESLRASVDQLKDASSRPDVLLTDLKQIADVVPS